MYFYDFLALLLGILALYLCIYYIVSPKSYKERLFQKHFKHSEILYKVLNIIFSFISGTLLITASLLNTFKIINTDNNSLYFTIVYILLVVFYLGSNAIIERIFVEKDVKVISVKK